MNKTILYVSFLIGSMSVSGTIDFNDKSIRFWDGNQYQNATVENYNIYQNKGTIKATHEGKTIVFSVERFSVKYFVKNQLINLRVKQKEWIFN